MSDDKWISVADYTDRISAEAIVGLLGQEKLPCYIFSNAHIPGLGSAFSVRVPPHILSQAQSLLEQSRVSESELTDLAMSVPAAEPPDA
jgi:hypothetical protein